MGTQQFQAENVRTFLVQFLVQKRSTKETEDPTRTAPSEMLRQGERRDFRSEEKSRHFSFASRAALLLGDLGRDEQRGRSGVEDEVERPLLVDLGADHDVLRDRRLEGDFVSLRPFGLIGLIRVRRSVRPRDGVTRQRNQRDQERKGQKPDEVHEELRSGKTLTTDNTDDTDKYKIIAKR